MDDIGEDGLTTIERMALFDSLPVELQRVLREAPYNYAIHDVIAAWDTLIDAGCSEKMAARQLREDFMRQARAQQRAEMRSKS